MNENSLKTYASIALTLEVVNRVMQGVSGNDVSNFIDGEHINKKTISTLASIKLNKILTGAA